MRSVGVPPSPRSLRRACCWRSISWSRDAIRLAFAPARRLCGGLVQLRDDAAQAGRASMLIVERREVDVMALPVADREPDAFADGRSGVERPALQLSEHIGILRREEVPVGAA